MRGYKYIHNHNIVLYHELQLLPQKQVAVARLWLWLLRLRLLSLSLSLRISRLLKYRKNKSSRISFSRRASGGEAKGEEGNSSALY